MNSLLLLSLDLLLALLLVPVLSKQPEPVSFEGDYVPPDRKMWCPPSNFADVRSRRRYNFTSAIISEIHGETRIVDDSIDSWKLFYDGHSMARTIHHHIGVLGIDKLYLTVIYNVSMHAKPPTIEEIYPADKSCVMDWYKLGVIELWPNPYFQPEEQRPFDREGRRTLDLDYYKTERGYTPIYAAIRNSTDWVIVMDIDEILVPVNFRPKDADWCSPHHPTVYHRAVDQILVSASRRRLKNYKRMNASREWEAPPNEACRLGWSFDEEGACKPVAFFTLPVYVWLNSGHSRAVDAMPDLRSRQSGAYVPAVLKTEDEDGSNQNWKSMYNTRISPPIRGWALHGNPNGGFSVGVPRAFHGRVSLELGHNKLPRTHEFDKLKTYLGAMVTDRRLQRLGSRWAQCMGDLHNHRNRYDEREDEERRAPKHK